MKKSFRLFIGVLMVLAVTSCKKDKLPMDTPSLEISPSSAILFTAAATESVVITVTTNQSSWNAVSNQTWCIVTKADGKFTVTATPNTATTPPPHLPATITVSAGEAQSRTIAVTQVAAQESYPSTEPELKQAISKTWVFPATSDFISLEFGAQDTYTLLSKKPFTKAVDAQTFLTVGTYTVEKDLKTFALSGFGKIVIKSFTEDQNKETVAMLEITPTGEAMSSQTMVPQKIETKPTNTDKHIYTMSMGEEVNAFTYIGDKLTLVEMKGVDESDQPTSISIPINYNGSTVSYEVDGQVLLGKPGTFKVSYTLNSAGLATSSTIENNSLLATIRYTYNAQRELILWQHYNSAGELETYCNAAWSNGNVTTIYHTDTQITQENYKKDYSYTAQLNKGGFMLPMGMPAIFESSDLFDYIGQWAGVLGRSCKNLMAQHASGDGDFTYTLDSEGYPTLLEVSYPGAPQDKWSLTMAFK